MKIQEIIQRIENEQKMINEKIINTDGLIRLREVAKN
jgi:hypothetical protein